MSGMGLRRSEAAPGLGSQAGSEPDDLNIDIRSAAQQNSRNIEPTGAQRKNSASAALRNS